MRVVIGTLDQDLTIRCSCSGMMVHRDSRSSADLVSKIFGHLL